MTKLYVVGLGPGGRESMTLSAIEAINNSQVIVGYKFYVDLIKDMLEGKEVISTGMRKEIE
ncbi:MAG: SAM-dependent methyltransferase, partial [Thermacetogeniaceae bacterium]